MPYGKVAKAQTCPIGTVAGETIHEPKSRRTEFYLNSKGEIVGKVCADCCRARSAAKRAKAKAAKAESPASA